MRKPKNQPKAEPTHEWYVDENKILRCKRIKQAEIIITRPDLQEALRALEGVGDLTAKNRQTIVNLLNREIAK